MKQPFFIVSSGRSGTTLLRVMLNAQPDVFLPDETDFPTRFEKYLKKFEPFEPKLHPLLARLFQASATAKGWELELSSIQAFLDATPPKSIQDVLASVATGYMKEQGITAKEWGIKSPALTSSLDKLIELYPNSPIIAVVRDGRDVALSYERVRFGPKGIALSTLYWADSITRLSVLPHDRSFVIRYEDLLSNPAETMEKVCRCIGTTFDKDALRAYAEDPKNAQSVPARFRQTFHKKVMTGIDPENSNKYFREMSRKNQWFFVLLAGNRLAQFGYTVPAWARSLALRPFQVLLQYVASILKNRKKSNFAKRQFTQIVAGNSDLMNFKN